MQSSSARSKLRQERAEVFIGDAFEQVREGAERCEQRLRPRVAEAKRGGSEAVGGAGGKDDAFERRGVGRAGARLKLGVEQPLVDLVADLEQRLEVSVGEQAADAEVAGVVDGRLGAKRPTLFEVLLDLRVLVVDLERGLHTATDDPGEETAG